MLKLCNCLDQYRMFLFIITKHRFLYDFSILMFDDYSTSRKPQELFDVCVKKQEREPVYSYDNLAAWHHLFSYSLRTHKSILC